jgi:ABC-type branched-subunit amino acid transport system ATPase component
MVSPSAAEPAVASEAAGGAPASKAQLRVDGVVAGYGGGDVLRGVSFEVVAGSITCIVGPNGAGKSTLLATISGMLCPRAGRITFDGHELVGRSPKQILSAGLVLVPQNHSLFRNMTVRENVEMGAFTIRDRSVVRDRLASIEELFPIVAERAGDKAGSLSGGQQRLVEFARSLMLDPSLVVLDEPSMGLDPKTLKTVFRTVREMNASGRTILLVEQNARAGLRLSSHGVVLENGLVRLSGTGRQVLEHPEIGALYLGGAVSAVPGSTPASNPDHL